jgi:hypothetical protein
VSAGLGVLEAGDATAPESLSLVISVFGGYEDILAGADRAVASDSRFGSGGVLSVAESTLRYARRVGRTSVEATAASTAFSDRHEVLGASHTAAAGVERSLSPRTNMHVRTGAGLAPFFELTPFPVASPSGLADPRLFNRNQAVTDDSVVYYSAGTGLGAELTSRSTLTLDYTARYAELLDRNDDLFEQAVGGRLERQLTRYNSLNVGLRARQGDHRLNEGRRLMRTLELDLGFGREWPISPTRSAAVSFSVGPSLVDEGDRRFYYVGGSMNLSYQMSRSWTASLAYQRVPDFVQGFARPLFADSATVGLSGLLSRHLGLQTSVGLARGHVGVAEGDGNYEAYTGSASLSFALTRSMAVYGQSFYYRYALRDAALAPGLDLSALDRRGLGVGVTWRIPLIAPRDGP